jgi:hypothetical protein
MGVSGRDSIQGLEIRRLQVFEQSYREREGKRENGRVRGREGGRQEGGERRRDVREGAM